MIKKVISLNAKFYKKAFSLIEISITMLIIGILIIGISNGIDLYADMRLSSARALTKNSRVERKGLIAWLEATSEKSFNQNEIVNDGAITSWLDINPIPIQKNNAKQLTLASKPQYVSKGINGLPSVKFSGSQFMVFEYPIPLATNTNALSIFAVISTGDIYNRRSAWGGGEVILRNQPGGDVAGSWYIAIMGNQGVTPNPEGQVTFHNLQNSTYNSTGVVRTQSPNLIKSFTSSALLSWIYDSSLGSSALSRISISVNGKKSTLSAGDTSTTWGSGSGWIGRGWEDATQYYFIGNIGEIILYDRALTSKERLATEEYLSKKWGIKTF